MFSHERFKILAETYGASLSRWPEAEREKAAALLASSPQARALLAAQQEVDTLLSGAFAADQALYDQQTELEKPDAAVMRLSLIVGEKISHKQQARSAWWTLSRLLARVGSARRRATLRWGVIALGAGAAAISGFWLGWKPTTSTSADLFSSLLTSALVGGTW
ncbi:hypothetical protein K2X14_12425 [Acetobacter sp. TBRC 12305]|uniref:Uncharacterized protein n=1 Tax=Acetobacter garciniae TaxID=2817435 RepID=A0A939KMW7_9PROT|nr:hypothetical protein [Acetobacter garciniae]MBO1325748.1 hypothetical protein [Acetobacter garciniae]MBX0345648.1 hypothetical protein [Acetobacter garciniae]